MATSLAPPRRRQLPPLRSRRVLALFDDDRLAREVARGSEAAFEVVYDRHHRGLLSFCRHLLGSPEEAEDAVQQTFASAYHGLMRTAGEVRLKPWLYTIARNRCISTIRARRTEPSDEIEPATRGLQEEVEQRADLRELLADMQRLALDQRSALILSELKGMSHLDVAEVLGCDVRKVKALVFQARSHLLEYRTARDTACADIRREISVRRRGAPSGAVRRHVAVCDGCAEFRDQVREQRRALGLLLPVLPAAGLKSKVLAAGGLGAGSAVGSGASGGAWLAVHAQLVKLASLGAAAITAAAVTVPLVSGGSRPADAETGPVPVHARPLVPMAAGGRAKPLATGGRAHGAAAGHHGAKRHAAKHRHHKAKAHSAPLAAKRSHTHRGAHQNGRRHAYAYAYGHRHAPGWLRHRAGATVLPQAHRHARRHRR